MEWFKENIVKPTARRAGGQTSAALVGAGMAAHHESAVAAVIAWAIVGAAELVISKANRVKLVEKTLENWGRN